jgi:hypothetical protein
LEKKKEQLLKESADVLAQQAELRSALWEDILRVDKRAEDLLGVDDEAADKLFVRKQILQKKLQDLDSTHFGVNEEFAKMVANLRMQTMDLPKRSGAIQCNFKEAINDILVKSHMCPCQPLKNKGKLQIFIFYPNLMHMNIYTCSFLLLMVRVTLNGYCFSSRYQRVL